MLELIEILKICKSIAIALFNRLGIMGIIALIVIFTCLIEYRIIENRNNTIVILKTSIKSQNDSIIEAKKQYEDVVKQVKDAEDKNIVLDMKYKALLFKLNTRPIANNCPDAINEVKDSAFMNSEIWNSGGKE